MEAKTQDKKERLLAGLPHFTGTTAYYRYLMDHVLTDGTKFLAETAGAFWLMDVIVSVQYMPEIRKQPFQSWTLSVDLASAKGRVICTDGNKRELYRQDFGFTDFPLNEITVFVSDKVIMLPSEN